MVDMHEFPCEIFEADPEIFWLAMEELNGVLRARGWFVGSSPHVRLPNFILMGIVVVVKDANG
jgi:hypothetical protein